MMQPATFLIGQHPISGPLWAGVDPNIRFTTPKIADGRFSAYLAPFPSEEAARAALLEAGAVGIEFERRSSSKRTR